MVSLMATKDDPPQGWMHCEGAGQSPTYVSGRGTQHWWRCPVCHWVGWSTRKAEQPACWTLPGHYRPLPPAPIDQVPGQLDLFT